MGMKREQWTKLDVPVTLEASRHTQKIHQLFVSPGGMFVPIDLGIDAYSPVTVRFSVEGRAVVAHTEMRRLLSTTEASDRGIYQSKGGTELRIVRMEGDGSQILAEHIKKILMDSGGPGA
jgi:hypothetical protein